MLNCLKCRVTF